MSIFIVISQQPDINFVKNRVDVNFIEAKVLDIFRMRNEWNLLNPSGIT